VSETQVTLHIFWNIKVTTGMLVLHLSGNIGTWAEPDLWISQILVVGLQLLKMQPAILK